MKDRSVLFSSHGTHFPNRFSGTPGRIELTTHSIIFYRISPLFMLFGLIGVLFSYASKGTLSLTIKLANVRGFERQRQGLTTKVLSFAMKDGTSHRLKIEKFDPFLKQLIEHLSSRYAVSDLGDNHWAVGENRHGR